MFYETQQDLLDICVPYLAAGLENNEGCVWVVSDPISPDAAIAGLRRGIPGLDGYLREGQIEILDAEGWYLPEVPFDAHRLLRGWSEKLAAGLSRGCEGLRITGNVPWTRPHQKTICEYEHDLERAMAKQNMIALCTYPLEASRGSDVLDVAREHQYAIARRNGAWELLQSPQSGHAIADRCNGAHSGLSNVFPGQQSLTPRERLVLAQIVSGASSKEAARRLGIMPRTVEFHRANIMKKLGARNSADLVRSVLAG